MKLAKLSLAAILVAGLSSSVCAADTLADAFKKGKVSGDLKAWYWDRGFEDTSKKDADLLTLGMSLTYVTDSFNGFKFGANVQTNNAPFASADAKTTTFSGDEYGTGAVLSEAYLAYTFGKTTTKVGRQYIMGTPLVGVSGSRVIKQSFEGATVVNTDLPNTTIFGAYLTKFLQRTSNDGSVGEFRDNFWYSQQSAIPVISDKTKGTGFKKAWNTITDSNVYSLMASNNSIAGLKLTAQWVKFEDLANLYFAEAAYAGKAADFSYGLFANYQITDYDSAVNDRDSGYYAFKAQMGFGGLSVYGAYSKIDDDTTAIPGAGGATYITNYVNSYWTPSFFIEGTETYAIDANYNFKQLGLTLGARFVNNDFAKIGGTAAYEIDATSVYMKYNFAGALKGLMAEIGYEDTDFSKANFDKTELRANFTYKF